jgi:hypothetical protein
MAAIARDFGFIGSSFFAKLAAVLFAFGRDAQTRHVGALLCFLGIHDSPFFSALGAVVMKHSMPERENSCARVSEGY